LIACLIGYPGLPSDETLLPRFLLEILVLIRQTGAAAQHAALFQV